MGLNLKKDNTYIIPIFIPHRGCKNNCVFCNQRKISGEIRDVTEQDIRDEINRFLNLYKNNLRKKQVAFFGGSFTGLDIDTQVRFLNIANEFIEKGLVEDIRISTRPDYINELTLKILKQKNVKVIELGVQSMDDDVLFASKRGHTAKDVIKASNLNKKYGFVLGHQVMVGLPKSTEEKEIETMRKCIELKPEIVRIYPVYVLRDSELFDMYESKKDIPLTIDEAVQRAGKMYEMCVNNKINVIRIGLQTTEEINSKNEEIKGPVCDNYKERVLSYLAYEKIKEKLKKTKENRNVILITNSKEVNYVVGENKRNLERLRSGYSGKVTFKVKE